MESLAMAKTTFTSATGQGSWHGTPVDTTQQQAP